VGVGQFNVNFEQVDAVLSQLLLRGSGQGPALSAFGLACTVRWGGFKLRREADVVKVEPIKTS